MISSFILFLALAAGNEAKPPPTYEKFGDLWAYIKTFPESHLTFKSDGWVHAVEGDLPNFTIWTLPPTKHPAFPSAARRVVTKGPGGFAISGAVICYHKREDACTQLKKEIEVMDKELLKDLSSLE